MKKLYSILVILLMLSACSKPAADIIPNINYTLENTPENTDVFLRFDSTGKIFGQGPINQYFGTYILDAKNNMIYIAIIGSSRMTGPENLMQAEEEYFTTLSQSNRVYTTKNKLILVAPGSRKLIFRK